MSKLKSFRIISLCFVAVFLATVFAIHLTGVKGRTEDKKTNQTNESIADSTGNILLPEPSPAPSETPHTLVGSYYLTDANTEAKLLLNNKGVQPLEVQPTLYNSQGQELQLPSVTVEPQNFRFVRLSDWAAIGGESYKSGNIKLFHYGKDLVLGAQIYLTDDAQSLSYEEKLTEKGKFDSRRQEAVWWMPSNDAKVQIVLTNTTDEALAVTGKLSKKPNVVGNPQNFELGAHQTRVFDLRNDFSNGNAFANAEILGLTLEHSGAKDALLARIMVAEPMRGYSNVVQFSNPSGGQSSEYQGVGFQIEDIANQRLTPVIAVRNVGSAPSTVTAKIPYTRLDGTRDSITIPTEKLSVGEMRLLNVQKIIQRVRQDDIKIASLEVLYDSAPGSVVVAAHSVSDDHNQVFRVPMWDPMGQRSPTGGYPWHIEGSSVTETYIKNIADYEEAYIAFLVWENGGIYMLGIKKIAAHETVHIDVKRLRDEQIPDERGRTIPLSVTSGQLQWTLRRKDDQPDDDRRANLALIGRSEQIDMAKGIVNNYACQNCCSGSFMGGYLEAAIPYETFLDLEVQSSRYYFAVEQQQTCYGFEYGPIVSEGIYNATWSSSNSSIATVTSGASGNVTGVDGGNVQISATWQKRMYIVYPCPPGGGGGGGPLLTQGEGETECSEKQDQNLVDKTKKTQNLKGEKQKEPIITADLAPCGTCTSRSSSFTASVNLTIKPKVQKIQYQEPGSSNYTDVTGTLYVLKGTTVNFKAIPYPNNATFPAGQPFWSGSSGAAGSGQLNSVTFNSVSSSPTDYKTVIASNGTPVSINVVVYELGPFFTPQDPFTGRSLVKFGLEEQVAISYVSTPELKQSWIGGMRWSIQTGTGQLASQDDGTANYTAPEIAESSTLKIEVLNGPSKGQSATFDITIVAPSGATEIQKPGSGIHHTNGFWGLGFLGWIRFDPTDVSFAKLRFKELATTATASGYLSAFQNHPHPETVGYATIGGCNLATGCRIMVDDEVLSEFIPFPNRPFAAGDFNWPIPWRCYTTNTTINMGIANHHATSNAAGDATLEKAGAGPFTSNYNDPTTSW
jgi:hypothetical protein